MSIKRLKAAIVIQKNFKKFVTQTLYQKVAEFEKNFIAIKWIPQEGYFQGESIEDLCKKKVSVIGSFSNPPWKKNIDLDYCPLRGIFVKYMSNMQEGTYLMKFVVDGQYQCSSDLPIITDAYGFQNNILEIDVQDEEEYEEQEQMNSVKNRLFNQELNQSISSTLKGLNSTHNDKKSVIGGRGGGSSVKSTQSWKQKKIKGAIVVKLNQRRLNLLEKQSSTSSHKKRMIEQYYQIENLDQFNEKFQTPEAQNMHKEEFFSLQHQQEDVLAPQFHLQQELQQQQQLDKATFTLENPSMQYSMYRKEQYEEQKQGKGIKNKGKKKNQQLIAYEGFYEDDPSAHDLIGGTSLWQEEEGLGGKIKGKDEAQINRRMGEHFQSMMGSGMMQRRDFNRSSGGGEATGAAASQQIPYNQQREYDDYYALYYYGEDQLLTSTEMSMNASVSQSQQVNPYGILAQLNNQNVIVEEIDTAQDSQSQIRQTPQHYSSISSKQSKNTNY